jgi:hypothetical protein
MMLTKDWILLGGAEVRARCDVCPSPQMPYYITGNTTIIMHHLLLTRTIHQQEQLHNNYGLSYATPREDLGHL